MNIEIPNDMSQRNILDLQNESIDKSYINSSDVMDKFLGRKTKRKQSELVEIDRTRCDICLEFEKYSETKLIECKKCGGICHKRCGESDVFSINKLKLNGAAKNEIDDDKWECLRCTNSKYSAPLNSGK
jgi:hypothetical protein